MQLSSVYLSRLGCLLVLLGLGIGCAPKLQIGPMTPDPTETNHVYLDVSLDMSEEYTDHTSKYRNHQGGQVFLGDALRSYAENVTHKIFTKDEMCPTPETSPYNSAVTLTPRLAYTTEHWEGSGGLSMQVTEVIVEWTMTSQGGDVIWSDLIRGAGTGRMGSKFTDGGNLRERTETAMSELYSASVDRMTCAPEIWFYSVCAPLYDIEASEHANLTKQIIDQAANCSSKDNVHQALVMFAVDRGSSSMLEVIRQHGISIDSPDYHFGTTPLGYALRLGDIETAQLLVSYGADPNYRGSDGRSLYFTAVADGNPPAIDYLTDLGATVYELDGDAYESMATAACYRLSAERELEAGNTFTHSEHSSKAVGFYRKAGGQFQQLESDLESKKQSIQIMNVFKTLAAVALAAAMDYGSELRARSEQRYRDQMRALRDASKAGTGIEGYYRNLASYTQASDYAFDKLRARSRGTGFSTVSSFYVSGSYAHMQYREVSTESLFSIKDTDQLKMEIEKMEILADLCRQSADGLEGVETAD